MENFIGAAPFSQNDSSGKPLFYLLHAFLDVLYKYRLDC
jgi:hypothetical protein